MPLWLKIIAQFIPVAMIIIGVYAAQEAWDFQSNSAASTAEIVSIREEYKSSTGTDGFSETTTTYYPTLRYLDEAGRIYVSESSQPASGFVPEIGQVISVRYYIDNPLWVRPVFSKWTVWTGPMIFVGIGLFFFIILSVIFRILKRVDAKREKGKTVRRY